MNEKRCGQIFGHIGHTYELPITVDGHTFDDAFYCDGNPPESVEPVADQNSPAAREALAVKRNGVMDIYHDGPRFIIREVASGPLDRAFEVVDKARNTVRTFPLGTAGETRLSAMMHMVETMYGSLAEHEDFSERRYRWAMEKVARDNRQRGGVYMPLDNSIRRDRVGRFANAMMAEWEDAGSPVDHDWHTPRAAALLAAFTRFREAN
jgi:hypothetical protein